MSRARERLVVLENLVDGAPTLPIDILLNDEPTGMSVEDILADVQDAVAAD
jgi:DNA helicase-2/ATP-dependent DNA helicase PcrA